MFEGTYTTLEDEVQGDSVPQGDILVAGRRSSDGSAVFVHVGDFVGTVQELKLEPPAGTVNMPIGFPRSGPGREKGSTLNVRKSLVSVLVVLLATTAYLNLNEIFEPKEADQEDLEGLRNQHYSLAKTTEKAIDTKAWDPSRSVYIGALINFESGASRDGEERHLVVAVELSLTSSGLVRTCSAEEPCHTVKERAMKHPMEHALGTVRAAQGVTMADILETLGVSLRIRSRALGRAVLYVNFFFFDRKLAGSWRFSVVCKTRAARWICFS